MMTGAGDYALDVPFRPAYWRYRRQRPGSLVRERLYLRVLAPVPVEMESLLRVRVL